MSRKRIFCEPYRKVSCLLEKEELSKEDLAKFLKDMKEGWTLEERKITTGVYGSEMVTFVFSED